jgi:hypothetical protein
MPPPKNATFYFSTYNPKKSNKMLNINLIPEAIAD